MRFHEIISELTHAMPLRHRPPQGAVKKATPIIPGAVPPMDPATAIATAIPQIAQAVAGGSQMAAQQAVAIDDEQEEQQAVLAAQQYQQKQPAQQPAKQR